VRSVDKWCRYIIENGKTDGEPNAQGNTVHRVFCDSERYDIDFADNFTAERWEQYDTDQDASYFGVWVNKFSGRILTYAEGDWTLVSCDCNEQFDREIAAMNAFYGSGFIAKIIDQNGNVEVLQQDRNSFFTED
jgi:hypothetical protein